MQLEQAAKAGVAPADVSMIAQVPMQRGLTADLWQRLDMAKMPNAAKVFEDFLNTYPDGRDRRWFRRSRGSLRSSPIPIPMGTRRKAGNSSGIPPTKTGLA